MKVKIYFDVFSWTTDSTSVFPTTTPGHKADGATRYRVDVEIPDPAKPDKVVMGKAVLEEGIQH